MLENESAKVKHAVVIEILQSRCVHAVVIEVSEHAIRFNHKRK